jgi:apolipoprotein D and lipocalin family protein
MPAARSACLTLLLLAGCGTMSKLPPLDPVERVELPRFMGDWYVIASIPTFIEKDAYNAVESYALADDGTIATTFKFRKGGFDGKQKTLTPTGFVTDDPSNAVWGMQFIWPIKAEYLIIRLDADYTRTVIGRNKRDHVWIMAREPEIPAAEYDDLIRWIAGQGYDVSAIRRVPQQWN